MTKVTDMIDCTNSVSDPQYITVLMLLELVCCFKNQWPKSSTSIWDEYFFVIHKHKGYQNVYE